MKKLQDIAARMADIEASLKEIEEELLETAVFAGTRESKAAKKALHHCVGAIYSCTAAREDLKSGYHPYVQLKSEFAAYKAETEALKAETEALKVEFAAYKAETDEWCENVSKWLVSIEERFPRTNLPPSKGSATEDPITRTETSSETSIETLNTKYKVEIPEGRTIVKNGKVCPRIITKNGLREK